MSPPGGIPAAYRTFAPRFDAFHTEPWVGDRVALDAIGERLAEHIRHAPEPLRTAKNPSGWVGEGGILGRECFETLYFLFGVGTISAGIVPSQLVALLDPWRETPARVEDLGALGRQTDYRPPDAWLVQVVGAEHRPAAFRWLRDIAAIWRAIPPLTERADALCRYFDDRLADAASADDPNLSTGDLPRAWATTTPPEVLAALPELYGPIGYVTWAAAELQRLRAQAAEITGGRPEPVEHEIAAHLRRFDFTEVPVPVAAAVDAVRPGLADDLRPLLRSDADFSERDAASYRELGRLVWAGHSDLARLLLERTSRLSLAIAIASRASDIWAVNTNLIRLADRLIALMTDLVAWPTVPVPETTTSAPMGWDAPTSAMSAVPFEDLRFQPELRGTLDSCLREIATAPATGRRPLLHVLIAGPEGTGQRYASRLYARGLAEAGAGSGDVHAVHIDELVGTSGFTFNPLATIRDAWAHAASGVLYVERIDRLVEGSVDGLGTLEAIRRN